MMATNSRVVPHPIPYQGSKRKLAHHILKLIDSEKIGVLYEPFCGSAAVTLAAAKIEKASEYHISDSLLPLAEIWNLIISDPDCLINGYKDVWNENAIDEPKYYNEIRDQFNSDNDPSKLLYLLSRCVKNSVRFNSKGSFNQSPDKRRIGTRPERMGKHIRQAHELLKGRTLVSGGDYKDILSAASKDDVVYMDPPYQGTSTGHDSRYYQGLDINSFYDYLDVLNTRGIPFLLSFDGRCGDKVYGEPLPKELNLKLVELFAGRSSQATLAGRNYMTIESLYISPASQST